MQKICFHCLKLNLDNTQCLNCELSVCKEFLNQDGYCKICEQKERVGQLVYSRWMAALSAKDGKSSLIINGIPRKTFRKEVESYEDAI